MDYREAIDWLYGRQKAGIKLGLNNIHRLLDALRLPHSGLRVVHVAGTNGKGSTCALAESVLRAAGFRTGLFTSPHLVSFCERIQIDGQPIAEAEAAAGIAALRELIAGWEEQPTFFELSTALALQCFADHEVEVAAVEVGLGGRLDSTNALAPAVCAITPIGLDHRHILGDTLAEIAAEKAGILKPGVPAVSAPQADEARAVLEARAAEVGATLAFIDEPWSASPVSLEGEHQQWNAALAVAALHMAGVPVSDSAIRTGLAEARWRARFERLTLEGGREIVVDGAHNPDGVRALADTWRARFGDSKPSVVFSASANKDTAALIAPLAEIAARFICTEPDTLRRTASPEDLAALLPDHLAAECVEGVDQAIARAREFPEPILVTGSLFLAGEALSLLDDRRDNFEPSDQ